MKKMESIRKTIKNYYKLAERKEFIFSLYDDHNIIYKRFWVMVRNIGKKKNSRNLETSKIGKCFFTQYYGGCCDGWDDYEKKKLFTRLSGMHITHKGLCKNWIRVKFTTTIFSFLSEAWKLRKFDEENEEYLIWYL